MLLLVLAGCAGGIPQAELDRCRLGVADGNEALQERQGAACRSVAARLASDEKPGDAMGYARKACELEDGRGCEQYLALARAQPSLPPEELFHARSVGERACAGMVVGVEGTDVRPAICARTAELYQDVEPRSADDAGRLFARACKLGDSHSCAYAKPGAADEAPVAPKAAPKAAAKAVPLPSPASAPQLPRATAPGVSAAGTAGQVRAGASCHEMRNCVVLDVNQRNMSEVVGTLTNRCDRAVACTWCPSRADQVDKSACHSGTLAPNESRSGREQGLWYEGFNAIAYDCMDAADEKGCMGI
jgi:hypothetical protein